VYPPAASLGTLNVREKPPVLLDVPVTTETELSVTVIVELAANPLPEILIGAPGKPFTGFRIMCALTVKVLECVIVPSVAVTVYIPPGIVGTTKVVEKVPVLVDVVVATVVVPRVIVMVFEGVNPAPVTVTVLPSIALTGLMVIVE